MSKTSIRIISFFLAIVMVSGMVTVPGVMTEASAAEFVGDQFIPGVETSYLNTDFNPNSLGGVTFNTYGKAGNVAETKLDNQTGNYYAYFERTDTSGNIDCLICAVGTGGTLTGTASTLKSCNPDLHVVAVEPKESAVLNGEPAGPHNIPGIGAGFIPELLDIQLINEVLDISSDDAIEMAKTAAKIEGLPIGISSGASLSAAIQVASRPEMQNKNIIIIFPSAVERYLSLGYFD